MERFGSAAQQTEIVLTKILEDGSLAVPARTIPLPDTISEAAQAMMSQRRSFNLAAEEPLEKLVERTSEMHARLSAESASIYPVAIGREEIGGVPCVIVDPIEETSPDNRRVVLVNLTAGGRFSGPATQVEAIPIAHLAKVKVVRPLFRRPPEYPFPADVDDVVAAYRGLLDDYAGENIGVYGACVGGALTFQLVSKLISLNLPLPGALSVWGAGGESTRITDSLRINHDLDPVTRGRPFNQRKRSSVNGIDVRDPVFSPIYAKLRLFPPTLLTAGTRDYALSAAALMHRALLRAGASAELVVFEAMDHGFTYYPSLPEAQELYEITARFLRRHLIREENRSLAAARAS
jgi:acetyl esterase/lipase